MRLIAMVMAVLLAFAVLAIPRRARADGPDDALRAELERVQGSPALSSDAHAIDALVAMAATASPGPTRSAVWVLAAEAYAHRLDRPHDADAVLARILADPTSDRITAQQAARDLVEARLANGDLTGAQQALALAGDRVTPSLVRTVARFARRRVAHGVAIGVLVAVIVLAARALVTALRRGERARIVRTVARTWKVVIAYALYVAVGGALLAAGYENGSSAPFLWFGAVLVPLLAVARLWGATGSARGAARMARAGLCAVGAASAAFLVLEGIDVRYLDGVGL